MWNAPFNKNFTLKGKFKKLFLEGVYQTLELFFQEGECEEGFITTNGTDYHKPFENFTNKEKIYSIAFVTKALISDKVKSPKLVQWNESAVYAVFESIKGSVSFEVDEADGLGKFAFRWRNLISKAQRECKMGLEEEDFIDVKCDNIREWETVIDNLADEILHDRDFEEDFESMIVDNPPELSDLLKYQGGIPTHYYTKTMGHVSKKKLKKASDFLRKVLK
jgi:hypothetical protein